MAKKTESNGVFGTQAEMRAWHQLSVHEKSGVIVCFYISASLFPWLVMTAVFAFCWGRVYGMEVGRLHAECEAEQRKTLRKEVEAELRGVAASGEIADDVLNQLPVEYAHAFDQPRYRSLDDGEKGEKEE